MADLLIRDASLPEHCGKCQFMADGWCYAVSQRPDDFVSFDRRPDFCPLVELPDHGPLCDLNALDKAFTALRFNEDGSLKHWDDRKNWCLHGSEIEKLLAEADTIIHASKEGAE